MKKQKRKIFLLSLFSLYMISVTGISGYAVVTGRVPPVVSAISSNFFSADASTKGVSSNSQSLTPLNPDADPSINPDAITPSDSITHESPSDSTSSVDPDAKVGDGQQNNPGGDYLPTEPVNVTSPQNPSSTSSEPSTSKPDSSSSQPNSSSPSSQDPASSSPSSSSPVSSSPEDGSSGGSGSSGSGGHTTRSITGISLDRTEITLDKGDIADLLVPTISPSNATGDRTITWSSVDTTVATVDSNGQVTAIGPGITEVVTRTSNGKTATCNVTVLVPATAIKINSLAFQIDKDSSKTLTATITPTDATDREIAWATSNADVLSIDSNGKVTAEDVGTAVITASVANGKIASTCDVAVGVSISKLTLDKSELNLIKGTKDTLTATIDPPDTTDDKTVEWSTTNPEVTNVDSNGNIQAVEGGTATITAQVGSHVAECVVTVSVPVTGITLNTNTLSMMRNTSEILTATIEPEDATNKNIMWSSSNNAIVSVDSTGKITTNDFGTATITATTEDGSFTAQCTVNVVTPVTGISLDKSVLILVRGTSSSLTSTVSPDNATNKNVFWQSSDDSIATVDSSGNVSGIGTGTALIRAITEDGGFTAVCAVSVTPDTYNVTANAVNGSVSGAGQYHVGSVVSLKATPSNHYHFVSWTNSEGTVISTNATYVVNGLYADMTLTANFEIDVYTVTVQAQTGGTVLGGGNFPYGSVITLTAVPDDRYEFVNWQDGVATASRNITVTSNTVYLANFKLKGYNWTYTLQAVNTREAHTTIANSSTYASMAVFSCPDGSGTGTTHSIYTFASPMLLKAGSNLKAIAAYVNAPETTILINGTQVLEITDNDLSYSGGNTQSSNYRVPSDIYVNTIEVLSTKDTSDGLLTPYTYTALFITPLNEKTFALNSTGTSEDQDCSNWYYEDAPDMNSDSHTFVSFYQGFVYYRKGTDRYAYFHFTNTKAIDHITAGPASSYSTTVKLYVKDYNQTSTTAYASKSMTDDASAVTFKSSDITSVDWNHITDLQINCSNSWEDINVPITVFYTDGTSVVFGTSTAHGTICG